MEDKTRSNLSIRSNVYPMPKDMASYINIHHIVGHEGEYIDHVAYARAVRGYRLFERLRDLGAFVKESKKGAFDFCGVHINKALTYGPIRKEGGIVYGCRCSIRDHCEYRIKTAQDCKNCPRNKD